MNGYFPFSANNYCWHLSIDHILPIRAEQWPNSQLTTALTYRKSLVSCFFAFHEFYLLNIYLRKLLIKLPSFSNCHQTGDKASECCSSSVWYACVPDVCFKKRLQEYNTESQDKCFKKTNHAKFSEEQIFLPPDTHTYVCVSGGKKCLFFQKSSVFSFLETPVLRFPLLPYYRQYVMWGAGSFSLRTSRKCRWVEPRRWRFSGSSVAA